jgi:hypothetical protein
MKRKKNLPTGTLRALAVEASVDPRTIAKVANGERVRSIAGMRARRALQKAGLLPAKENR